MTLGGQSHNVTFDAGTMNYVANVNVLLPTVGPGANAAPVTV